jgi:hypothetical protein
MDAAANVAPAGRDGYVAELESVRAHRRTASLIVPTGSVVRMDVADSAEPVVLMKYVFPVSVSQKPKPLISTRMC